MLVLVLVLVPVVCECCVKAERAVEARVRNSFVNLLSKCVLVLVLVLVLRVSVSISVSVNRIEKDM